MNLETHVDRLKQLKDFLFRGRKIDSAQAIMKIILFFFPAKTVLRIFSLPQKNSFISLPKVQCLQLHFGADRCLTETFHSFHKCDHKTKNRDAKCCRGYFFLIWNWLEFERSTELDRSRIEPV